MVNGVTIKVTQTLGEALRRMEKEEEVNFLWADALCINQDSEAEKIHQVRAMGDIYSRAEAVMAWLGPEAESSDAVMDDIGRVGPMVKGWLLNISIPGDQADEVVAAMNVGPHKLFKTLVKFIPFIFDPDYGGQDAALELHRVAEQMPSSGWSAFLMRSFWRRS